METIHYNNMTSEEKQFIANWAQLVNDNYSFIVPARSYNVSQDERLLIPVLSHHKIGFVNREGVCVVTPKYDKVWRDVVNPEDVVTVGVLQYSDCCKWGLLDSNGKEIFGVIYSQIAVSDDRQLFCLQSFGGGYSVCNRQGEVIVPEGVYDYIDGFTKGYARVKIARATNGSLLFANKWGIINTKGEVVLPVEYDNIWNFHEGKDWPYTTIEKQGVGQGKFWFANGSTVKPEPVRKSSYYGDDYSNYGRHYGEFEGTYAQDVMGYDDDTINDAFDGEADAYWNID